MPDSYDEARAGLRAAAEQRGFATEPPQGIPGAGEFCRRHWGKLSRPMQKSLAVARKHGDDEQKVLQEAVTQARTNDDDWHGYAVLDRERVEAFDSWQEAVERYAALRESELIPVILSARAGRLLTVYEIRAYCPQRVVFAGDFEDVVETTLGKAVEVAFRRWVPRNGAGPNWPSATPPTVVNLWTGEELTWREACVSATRGHR